MYKEQDLKEGKILIVDDELAQVEMLAQVLRMDGFRNVEATTDPEYALNQCLTIAPDLLLLDLNMPRINGLDILAEFNASTKEDLPLTLVISGQNSAELRRQVLDSRARDYVLKPFNVTELLSRVKNLLEMKMLQNHMRDQNQKLESLVKERTAALTKQANDLVNTQRNLTKTRMQVVQKLGRAAEYRDNETGFHIIRMSKMSALLALKAGLSDYEVNLILDASPMHDVGKIGIPDKVLLKPGKLTPAEWRVMKTHSRIGADILEGDDSDLLRLASEIALTHHERWDGSGYPEGLSGEQIPIAGRICAIADVFDALSSRRPYKNPWSVEEVIAHINRQSGTHFDPYLVDVFNANSNYFRSIKEEYEEPDNAMMLDRMDESTGVINLHTA